MAHQNENAGMLFLWRLQHNNSTNYKKLTVLLIVLLKKPMDLENGRVKVILILKEEQTSYDDSLDKLRLSLIGYSIT
jgi:hypothetical protein